MIGQARQFKVVNATERILSKTMNFESGFIRPQLATLMWKINFEVANKNCELFFARN